MNGLSLRAKILSLSVFLLMISLAVGGTSYFSSNTVTGNYEKIVALSVPKLKGSYDMMLDFRRVRISLRTLGLQGLPKSEADLALKGAADAIAKYETDESEYLSHGFMPGQEVKFNRMHAAWVNFKATGDEIGKRYHAGTPVDLEQMQKILLTTDPDRAAIFTAATEDIIDFHDSNMKTWVETARAAASSSNQIILTIILAGIAFGIAVGFIIAGKVARSIGAVAKELADGANQVSQASMQIAESSQGLSQSTTEQASSLEETVATMEEMTAMVKLNTENGKQAAHLAASTRDIALRGDTEIAALIISIQTIAADSKKIEEITGVIDDIAFQTNLLALNAAVEAARAGEQGKGFAVVAEAVRALSLRSASAAKDINGLIKNSVEKIENGSLQAARGGAVLAEIVNSVKKVADLNGEIATASEEQSNGLTQISKAMNQLDQVTQANAAASEEAAAAAEQLSAQSVILKQNVISLESSVFGGSKAA